MSVVPNAQWQKRNYRCEASVPPYRQAEQIVEFLDMDPVSSRTGLEVTRGEQYVSGRAYRPLPCLQLADSWPARALPPRLSSSQE